MDNIAQMSYTTAHLASFSPQLRKGGITENIEPPETGFLPNEAIFTQGGRKVIPKMPASSARYTAPPN
jgi:hypothetical protein